MKVVTDSTWIRMGDPEQSSSFTGDLAGKYLFFSKSKQTLLQLAWDEITEHDFEVAKVSRFPRGCEHVLCLYWHDDSRRVELAQRHADRTDVKYRWWKSNADTRAGKYSAEFRAWAEYHKGKTDHLDPDMDHYDWIERFGDLT